MANTNQQNKKKYHIIYKTVNLTNKKFYIGAHSTDNLEDEYYGSGTNINRAMNKYGKKSFKKEILYIFKTPKEMFLKEKEIVTTNFIKRNDVYNIVEGGYGGFNRGATNLKHLHHPTSKERCAVHPNAVDKMLQQGWKLGFLEAWQKGKIYVHKKNKTKVIKPLELNFFLSKGWKKGFFKSPTKNMLWIFNPKIKKYSLCSKENLNKMIENGWIKKKEAPFIKGKTVWINNYKKNLRIKKNQLYKYLKNGWVRGAVQNHSKN
jgi:hypothetical protein